MQGHSRALVPDGRRVPGVLTRHAGRTPPKRLYTQGYATTECPPGQRCKCFWEARHWRLKKEPYLGHRIGEVGYSPWPHACSGLAEKPALAVWQHIDFRKVNLTLFFCLYAIYHIEMTRIPTLYFVSLVNMTRFVIFLPLCLLPYQNDTTFRAIFCISGQYDMPPRRSPRRTYRSWRLGVSYFPESLCIGTMFA